ncbi:MAG: bifunctional aspartokinase / homoserine dehydrogenase 1 [Blastocatellia bacterium]|jgi:aspartate kinase|nr:bifunctional aspartokinase / homoserine dehydrogenase 1 [Blastocatellia bacterium]
MSEKIRVMKFGGTSVGDAECIGRAAKIVAAGGGATVAVVSAMSGVTDRLINALKASAAGDSGAAGELGLALRAQHLAAIERLIRDDETRARLFAEMETIIEEAASLCRGTALLRELTPRTLDAVSSAGERLSARLLASALRNLGFESVAVEATELIVTNDEHCQAEPLMSETRERARARLLPLIEAGTLPVVTGFIGATVEGTLTTLGRGGSDYSATILGAALDAEEVIIWTDVDGVLTADPRLVAGARTLREISYNEAAELAYFGAKVLHPKTLRPVSEACIPVWIRNSFEPQLPGTKITATGHPTARGVKAITAIKGVSLITVGGAGIVGVHGVAAKTFAAAAKARANVMLISQSSSQNDICFIVNSENLPRTVEALRQTFAADLAHRQVEHINVTPEIAVVAVVGKMRGLPGIAGRVFSALGDKGINIIAIAQGSSEYNVSFVIEAGALHDAVIAVHSEFDLQQPAPVLEATESEGALTEA